MPDKPFKLSAKVLIRDAEGRCLVIRRSRESRHNKAKWDLPGGKVDAGETFDQALVREVEEETGLSISLECVAGAAQSEAPDRIVAYMIMEGRWVSGEVRLSAEHDDHAWVAPADLPGMDLCEQFMEFAREYAR